MKRFVFLVEHQDNKALHALRTHLAKVLQKHDATFTVEPVSDKPTGCYRVIINPHPRRPDDDKPADDAVAIFKNLDFFVRFGHSEDTRLIDEFGRRLTQPESFA